MFPAGLPGIALVLLRASVAVQLPFGLADAWLCVGLIGMALALSLGVVTPLAAIAVLLLQLSRFVLPMPLPCDALGIAALDAAALALLGPGAYSIDARLFGRRVLVLDKPADDRR